MNKNILLQWARTSAEAKALGYKSLAEFKRLQKTAQDKRDSRAARNKEVDNTLLDRFCRHKNGKEGRLIDWGGRPNNIVYSTPPDITVHNFRYKTSGCRQWGDHYSNTDVVLVNPRKWSISEISGVTTAVRRGGIEAVWLRHSVGYRYRVVRGICVGGTHIECETVTQGLRKFAIAKKAQQKANELSKLHAAGRLFWVTLADSLRAGNCNVGTDAFIRRHNLTNLGAIRSDALIELEDSSFTRRAIGVSAHLAN